MNSATAETQHPLLDSVSEVIRTRRVTRDFADTPVSREQLELLIRSARWAPNGGRRRLNVYVVIDDRKTLSKLRAVTPGLLARPTAVILMCLDEARANQLGYKYWEQTSAFVDLGTSLQNILLTAHALGLGSGPVMSFHRQAVQLLLDLPATLQPEVIVKLGYPAYPRPVNLPHLDISKFTHWGKYDPTHGE